MSPGIAGVCLSLSSIVTMASKRVGSKDTVGSETGDAAEHVSMGLPIYEDTKLVIDKDIKMKWKEINDTFSGTFEEDLEDHRVYVNVHKSGLYQIACRHPTFPCANTIHWIVSHVDPEMMMLSSVSGTDLATFKVMDYQVMYHLP